MNPTPIRRPRTTHILVNANEAPVSSLSDSFVRLLDHELRPLRDAAQSVVDYHSTQMAVGMRELIRSTNHGF